MVVKKQLIPILLISMFLFSLLTPSHVSYQASIVPDMKLGDMDGPSFSNFHLDPSDADTYYADYQGLVEVDVDDIDEVDMVWLQYHWEDDSSWSNGIMESQAPFHNETYTGYIIGILQPGDNRFFVKFFANDTFGNLAESEIHNRTVYYMREEGPTPFLYYLIPALAVSSVVLVLIGLGFWWYKKRQ